MQKTAKLQANGCILEVAIKGNEQSDHVVVMLHGGPGSGMKPIMELQAMQRLEEAFILVYFDQRGTGNSYYDIRKRLSKQQITNDVKLVVDFAKQTFPNKKIYLWGASFGGLLGLMFLDRFPLAVKKAVIASPAIYLSSEEMIIKQFQFLQATENTLFPNTIFNQLKAITPSKENLMLFMGSKEVQAFFHQYEMPIQNNEDFFHFNAMREWILDACDYRTTLKTLQIPTLLLQGMDDPICSAEVLIDAFEQCGNPLVSLKTYDNCGHGVFDDCQDEFVKACLSFYQE